jgi:tetratricopeptide (TPR) repeat protein
MAMRDKDEKSPSRAEHLRASRQYFSNLEGLGEHDPELYDRLCELSLATGDNKSFLSYAKKSVDQYPFDRQYYNLGIGYFNVGDYANVIKVEKLAIEKFRTSPYMSSYYRQLGRAYMKMDRDQTAERTFDDGLRIVIERLGARTSPDDFRRLMDDKIAMLLSLKHLCQRYHKDDKLKQVEHQLQEAGYSGK